VVSSEQIFVFIFSVIKESLFSIVFVFVRAVALRLAVMLYLLFIVYFVYLTTCF